MIINKNQIWIWLLALGLTFSSCGDDDIDPRSTTPITLTKSTLVNSRSSGELQVFVSVAGIDLDLSVIKYGVDTYEVEYNTLYKGQTITASGMVMIPKTSDEVALISFQHGTVAGAGQVPSTLPINDGQIYLLQAMAATGSITVAPDFIGFGASEEIMHPYYVEDLTASAIVDNIYAAANLADQLPDVKLSNRMYLTGYSQGGYATMAAHKFVQDQGIERFELQASFPSSGGYDVTGVRDYFFTQETYDQPFFLAFVAQAYNVTYDWGLNMDVFFNEPYASRIPNLFDGSLTGSEINAELTTNLTELLNVEFRENVNTNPTYTQVNTAFTENSLLDWTPTIRMAMYHGDADITVPYQNSVDVYNHFIEGGASSSIVTFTPLPEGTHGTGVIPWIELFVTEIIEMEAANVN